MEERPGGIPLSISTMICAETRQPFVAAGFLVILLTCRLSCEWLTKNPGEYRFARSPTPKFGKYRFCVSTYAAATPGSRSNPVLGNVIDAIVVLATRLLSLLENASAVTGLIGDYSAFDRPRHARGVWGGKQLTACQGSQFSRSFFFFVHFISKLPLEPRGKKKGGWIGWGAALMQRIGQQHMHHQNWLCCGLN